MRSRKYDEQEFWQSSLFYVKASLVFLQVGGNAAAKAFFKSESDYRDGMSISEKYHTKAAALYRDKVITLPFSKNTK